MKVLVVKLSALGDILHAMPAVRRMVEEGHETSWAVDARYARVLELFPGLAHVHVLDPKGWGEAAWRMRLGRALADMGTQVERFRRAGYHVALDLQGLVKSGIVARISGAGRVAGFETRACRERAAALFYRERIPVDLDLPIADQLLHAAASALGFEPRRTDPGLVVPADDVAAAKALTEGSSPILLVVGAGWPTKVLPASTFRRVAAALSSVGPVIALSGSDGERERAMAVVGGLQGGRVVDRLELPTLAGLLQRARVVIGGDTGLVHLAALLGTPTVSFYGASLGARSGPTGPRHRRIQSSAECSPCFSRRCDSMSCMDDIDGDDIVGAVLEVISSNVSAR